MSGKKEGWPIVQKIKGKIFGNDAPQISSDPELADGVREKTEIVTEKQEIHDFQVQNLEQVYPQATLIESVEKEPLLERMPSMASMTVERIPGLVAIDPKELVWLTPKSVVDRLQVWFHTDPSFSQSPAISGIVGRPASDVLKNVPSGMENFGLVQHETIRTPISTEAMIDILKQRGFKFVKDKNSTVMIVDATIPAQDNTAGGYAFGEKRTNFGERVYAEAQKILSRDGDKIGIRPATDHSTHIIAIPLEKLKEMHNSNPPLEVNKLGWPDQFDRLRFSRNFRKAGGRFFSLLKEQPEFKEIMDKLFDREGNHREQKIILYNLLTEKLGLRKGITIDGYFPNEPIFVFKPERGRNYENIDNNFLKDLNDYAYNSKGHNFDRFAVMLEDILYAIQHLPED